jgi:acetylornithine deacetylase
MGDDGDKVAREGVRDAARSNLSAAMEMLGRLMRFPSVSGAEHEAMLFLEEQFRALPGVRVERVPLADSIKRDPDYSDPVPDISYNGRFNLRIVRPGTGGAGRTLLLNTHTDVVPPSEGMVDPWAGVIRDGTVWGRGACDAKGQVAAIYLLLRTLAALDLRTGGDLVAHLVVEEENGGNGTLAMARRGEKADGCIVLEPTDGAVHTSIRGAVWFRIVFTGKAGHSGQASVSRSALLMARDAMAILEGYHDRLLVESRGFPLFDPYPNPMPLTFGRLHAGTWPASAPSEAVLEGVLGLLPNRTKEQVCEEIRRSLASSADEFLASHFDLRFLYRHDSSVLDPGHPLPRTILDAGETAGASLRVSGMTASCDAWFYNNVLGIPTVVYGPGALKHAHTKDERISADEIGRAAEVLAHATRKYCGA